VMTLNRECKVCKETKELHLFAKNKQSKYGREHQCQSCRTESINKRRRENKLKAIEYKGGKCNRCGQIFHQAVYDFHHMDISDKEADPGSLMHRTWDRLKEELDKCVLLCSNCHRLTHWEIDCNENNKY
jgi:superfamily II helicase